MRTWGSEIVRSWNPVDQGQNIWNNSSAANLWHPHRRHLYPLARVLRWCRRLFGLRQLLDEQVRFTPFHCFLLVVISRGVTYISSQVHAEPCPHRQSVFRFVLFRCLVVLRASQASSIGKENTAGGQRWIDQLHTYRHEWPVLRNHHQVSYLEESPAEFRF